MNIQLGFLSCLGLIFITLKLLDQIDWTWTWVLSPFWVPIVVAVALVFVGAFLEMFK